MKRFLRSLAARYHCNLSDDPTWKIAFVALLGVALTFALPLTLSHAVTSVNAARQSSGWPTTRVTITRADIRVSTGRRGARSYEPTVEYVYQLGGRTYTGNRIAYRGYASRIEESARAVLDRYAVGSSHQAHYNPDDPSQSVLEPGDHVLTWLMFAFPLICLAGPFFAFTHGLVLWYRMTALQHDR